MINNELNKEQADKFLKIIYRHSNRLNSIIDDLLMLAGLEKSDSNFVFERFPVSDLISSVLNVVAVKADKSLIDIPLVHIPFGVANKKIITLSEIKDFDELDMSIY